MNSYSAIFESGEGSHIVVTFPDLPGCFTQGDTESDAMAMASDALRGHIATLAELGKSIPKPSPFAAIHAPAGTRIMLIPFSEFMKNDQAGAIRARTYGWEDIAPEDRAAFKKFMLGRGHPMAGDEERFYAADVREFCSRVGLPCPQLGGGNPHG
jgi:predicted RNase H-like HicB family nuclease